MSRTLQSTPTENQNAGEEVVWPEFAPSPGYRSFIERLRRARIECGLSIPDMAKRVGLGFQLAHEFENLITPLPFCHLSLWSEAVGVPFEDFVAIYNAEMEELFDAQEREAQEREAQEREAQEREAREREAQEREAQEREAQEREREAQEREAQEREAQEREAQEREFREREFREREFRERKAEPNAPCITNTEAPTLAPTEAPAPAPTSVSRGGGFLNLLRSVAAHIRDHFLSRFSTPKETSK